jgi:hypothetical protein
VPRQPRGARSACEDDAQDVAVIELVGEVAQVEELARSARRVPRP